MGTFGTPNYSSYYLKRGRERRTVHAGVVGSLSLINVSERELGPLLA
jgi:hypothetical protein